MIKIETKNETPEGYDIETRIEGNGLIIVQQMASILDRLYEASPDLFEKALLLSRYTKDHT